MGGGSSRSSSSNRTSSIVDNSNTQIHSDGGTVVEGVSNSTITVTDGGAVENALKFGEDALDSVDDAVDRSLDTVDDAVFDAFDFGDTALSESFQFGRDNLEFSKNFSEFVLNEAQETSQNAINLATQSQSDALNKVSDLVNNISSGDSARTKQLLIAVAAVFLVLGFSVFLIIRANKK